MTNPSTANLREPSSWLADTLRLSAFPSPSAQIDSSGWWENVVGHLSDNQTFQRSKGQMEEQGSFDDGQLILAVQPLRVDWLYRVAIDQESGFTNFDKLVPLSRAVESFLRVAKSWFPMSPTLRRLAFGAVLLTPVPDRATGYRKLASYLHYVKLEPERSSDFSYEINRPRELTNELSIKLNRLSKWSVAQLGLAQISLMPGTSPHVILGQKTNAIRLELDINTDADIQGELPQGLLSELLRTLVTQAGEIAEKGDIE